MAEYRHDPSPKAASLTLAAFDPPSRGGLPPASAAEQKTLLTHSSRNFFPILCGQSEALSISSRHNLSFSLELLLEVGGS